MKIYFKSSPKERDNKKKQIPKMSKNENRKEVKPEQYKIHYVRKE